MKNQEVNPFVATVVGVIVLGLVVFFAFRAMQPATPSRSSYTPGVPPWKEKGATAASSTATVAPSPTAATATPPPPPPGMNVPPPPPK